MIAAGVSRALWLGHYRAIMAGYYEVQDGDTMALIASKHGFRDWRALYQHPDNASFRRACADPNLLRVGARLAVPDRPGPSRMSVRTGAEHTFVLRRPREVLRVCLHSPRAEPLAGWRYKIELGPHQHEGVVPDDGELEIPIPEPVGRGMLWAWPADVEGPNDDDAIELRVGGLEPADVATAHQARLANLGVFEGELDSDLSSPASRSAMKQIGAMEAAEIVAKHGC